MPREEPPSPSPAPAPPAGFAHDAVRVKHAALATLRLRCVLCGDSAVGKTALARAAAAQLRGQGLEFPRNYVATTAPEWSSLLVRVPAGELPPGAPPTQVEILLLDTPGGATFNLRADAGQQRLWGSCQAALVAFDVGSRESLRSADKWALRVHTAAAAAAGAGAGAGAGANNAAGASAAAAAAAAEAAALTPSRRQGVLVAALVGTKGDFREAGVDRAEVGADEARAAAARMQRGSGLGAPPGAAQAGAPGAAQGGAQGCEYFETSVERGAGVERPFAHIAASFARHVYAERARESAEDDDDD